jgi:nucleoside-diphosphate-sugar epimerase
MMTMKIVLLSLLPSLAAGFSLSMSSALIVQNKGGGHGELGYQLAKNLKTNPKITSITILQDDACKDTKEPFKSYASDLPDVKIIKAPLGDEQLTADTLKFMLEGQRFDYIWDNASKGASGAGKAVVDCAKDWGCKLLTYVSSAGAYKPTADTVFPMPETTPVKESAGQVEYENYATQQGLPFCSFRPQYIYGPKANKYDYIDWYFDRLSRDLPLPIPGSGNQKVSLTNSVDVASLLASVLNNEAAAVQQRIFNCGTDQLLSYTEVAFLCAEVAGIPNPDIYLYDGDEYGKGEFPFRLTDFYVAPDMAKSKLGWPGPQHSLRGDLGWYFEGYKARGGPTRHVDFGKDWEIVVGSKPSLLGTESVYDKWDPLVIDMSKAKKLEMETN